MPVNFKYLPLVPEPISGPSFIDQTEAAFNELGAEIDANTAAANEALTTANNAAQTAEAALETALDTVSTANTALTTANTALSNSSTAFNMANTAYDMAVTAESVSQIANTTANTANTTAIAAEAVATTAVNAASSALTIAESANANAINAVEIAASANDMYVIDVTVRDATEAYETPERSYLSNPNNTNFPVAMPCYFNVLSTGNNAAATQQCWNDGQTLYRRFATIDNTYPENLIVTWSDWAEFASDGGSLGGGFNKEDFIFVSGTYKPPVDGWYRITLVGGGGSGGRGGNHNYTPSTARDIIGASGGGGGAGESGQFYIHLLTTNMIVITVGAGGAAVSNNSSTPQALTGNNGGNTSLVVYETSSLASRKAAYLVNGGVASSAGDILATTDANISVYKGGTWGYSLSINTNNDEYLADYGEALFDMPITRIVNVSTGHGTAGESGNTASGSYFSFRITNGGDGGSNGTRFGGGGGGGCGMTTTNAGKTKLPGTGGKNGDAGSITTSGPSMNDPMAPDVYLYYGSIASGTNGIGGRGGDGAVILEYFDPDL